MSQLNTNILCSYIFTLFLGLMGIFVIKSFIIETQLNNFAIDVFDNSGSLSDLIVHVYVNGKKQKLTTDYIVENINNKPSGRIIIRRVGE